MNVCENCLKFIPDEDFVTVYGECVIIRRFVARKHTCEKWEAKPEIKMS